LATLALPIDSSAPGLVEHRRWLLEGPCSVYALGRPLRSATARGGR